MVYKSVFLSPPILDYSELIVIPGVAYQTVTKVVICKAPMTQLTSKVLRPDEINFQILYIV